MNCEVTIGVVARNNAATWEAIESIVGQDFPHELMELIFVDGHSSDETLSIIQKSLENTVIKNRIFEENKGMGLCKASCG